MQILQLIPGTGSFLCGSCSRDNALAAGLRGLGHGVQIVPLYLPFELEDPPQTPVPQVHPAVANLLCESTRISPEWADSVDVQASHRKSPVVRFGRRQPLRLSRPKRAAGGFLGPTDVKQVGNSGVHMGGVNVFLQQKLPVLAHLPRFLRDLFDGNGFLRWISSLGNMTEPTALGELTISMLRGEEGRQAKELERLLDWLRGQPAPDIILISNAMLIGLARPMRSALGAPVVCTLQGEQPFLDALHLRDSRTCWSILTERARDVDAFIAVSAFTGRLMTERMSLPPSKVFVVPNGIDVRGFSPAAEPPALPTIGFLARMCADKGLPVLVEAYLRLLERGKVPNVRLVIVGVQLACDRRGVRALQRRCAAAGVADRVEFHPNVTREQKIEHLRSFSLLCVPAGYGESFGLYLLEAMACGVPVVQPRCAGFTEILEATGGGLLYDPDDPEALVGALETLLLDPLLSRELGATGNAAVRSAFNTDRMARDAALVFENVLTGPSQHSPPTSSRRSR